MGGDDNRVEQRVGDLGPRLRAGNTLAHRRVVQRRRALPHEISDQTTWHGLDPLPTVARREGALPLGIACRRRIASLPVQPGKKFPAIDHAVDLGAVPLSVDGPAHEHPERQPDEAAHRAGAQLYPQHAARVQADRATHQRGSIRNLRRGVSDRTRHLHSSTPSERHDAEPACLTRRAHGARSVQSRPASHLPCIHRPASWVASRDCAAPFGSRVLSPASHRNGLMRRPTRPGPRRVRYRPARVCRAVRSDPNVRRRHTRRGPPSPPP